MPLPLRPSARTPRSDAALNKAFADGAYNLWNWYTEWGIGTTSDVKNITSTELPGGVKGAGMNWGWHFLTETWIEE